MSKNVCFVMPGMSGGGAERVVSILANEFVREGHDVTIFLTNFTQIAYDLDDRIHIDMSCAQSKANFVGQIRAIRKKMKDLRDAVFISFMDNQNLFTIIAGIGMPNHVVISQRNDPHRAFEGRTLVRALHPWIYTWADYVVMQTQDALEYYPSYAKNKYSVILNPLNSNLPARYEGPRSHRVVAVCRLNEQKNLPLALDAFKDFSVDFSDYTFEIYGEGELKDELQAYATNIGIGRKVLFKGFRKNVYDCIIDASMFIISSDFEGLSNSMIEAIALGIPTIATDCPIGGARMVINNGRNGYLVPVRDRAKLAAAMKKIAGSPEIQKRFGEEGVKLRDRLSIHSIVNQWLSVIEMSK
ncbi:glycosyltransferase [Bifidobacterium callimiconis]|uniref:glycosyltransferase n=1 Tax=Bifidobacterium callimiconis TaxID=2306973 RepID=UPI001BDBE760|nr:glycosyltransferase [Bifidobacterium callimiconis]MBT1177146.1 glycosyltransferase [Bifidobacterium callimiconis]